MSKYLSNSRVTNFNLQVTSLSAKVTWINARVTSGYAVWGAGGQTDYLYSEGVTPYLSLKVFAKLDRLEMPIS